MTPAECERIFERIEELKKSTAKYIQDIAHFVQRVNDGYIVPNNNEDEDMDFDFLPEEDEDMEFDFIPEEDEDMYAFLVETFDLN